MTSSARNDQDWDRTAHVLASMLEQATTLDDVAISHLRDELALLDGWPGQTLGDGLPGGSYDPTKDLTPVERVAHVRHLVETQIRQIVDDREAVRQVILSYVFGLQRAVRMRGLSDIVAEIRGIRLCDGTQFEGSHLPWTKHSRRPENGWFDPSCRDVADESGLCPACKIRERRWRAAHGLNPRTNNTSQPPRTPA